MAGLLSCRLLQLITVTTVEKCLIWENTPEQCPDFESLCEFAWTFTAPHKHSPDRYFTVNYKSN